MYPVFIIHRIFSVLAGFDYIPVTTTIVFPAGMTQVMVPVSSVEDMVAEVTESFGAVLTNPSDRLLIGMQDQATVTIIDDDGRRGRGREGGREGGTHFHFFLRLDGQF